jgi:hypothetical protein
LKERRQQQQHALAGGGTDAAVAPHRLAEPAEDRSAEDERERQRPAEFGRPAPPAAEQRSQGSSATKPSTQAPRA